MNLVLRLRRALPSVLLAAGVVVSMAGVMACEGSDVLPSPSASAGSAVVVRVDGEDVTKAQIGAVRAEARLSGGGDSASEALDEAVRRVLVRGEADRLGIRIDDEAIRQRVTSMEQSAGGAKALDATLGRAAMTREQLYEAVHYALLAGAVAAAKHANLKASPAEVRAFYDRHRDDTYTTGASYRLAKITVPGERLARRLVRRLRKGASFADLAGRYSMDNQTRYSGGEIGWVSAMTVPQEVLAAVTPVAAGGIADPVKSSGKWQVFKVLGKRSARVVPFSEARAAIAEELTRRHRARALTHWIEQKLKRVEVVKAR